MKKRKISQKAIDRAADKARVRVSLMSREEKAELLKRAKKIIYGPKTTAGELGPNFSMP
jgi:hypothetical protein